MTDTTWRGKLGPMSDDEREAFLAKDYVMRIACLKADGSPYITVCWQDWHDGYFWLVPTSVLAGRGCLRGMGGSPSSSTTTSRWRR